MLTPTLTLALQDGDYNKCKKNTHEKLILLKQPGETIPLLGTWSLNN